MSMDDEKSCLSHELVVLSKHSHPKSDYNTPFVFRAVVENNTTSYIGCESYSIKDNQQSIRINLPYVYINESKKWYRVHGGGGNGNGMMAGKHLSYVLGLKLNTIDTTLGEHYPSNAKDQ